MTHIDIVFAKSPDPNPDFRFVEVEDASGASVEIGTWLQRADGYWVLRIEQGTPIYQLHTNSGFWMDVSKIEWEYIDVLYSRKYNAKRIVCAPKDQP